MDRSVETWIVVADGSGARIFEEVIRLGPLSERPDLAVASDEDRKRRSSHTATVVARSGYARHGAGEADPAPAAAAERRFLSQIARQIDKAALAGSFRQLVLVAPPAALGVLRGALAPATARRIELCDPHERHGEDAAALRSRLQALRAAG